MRGPRDLDPTSRVCFHVDGRCRRVSSTRLLSLFVPEMSALAKAFCTSPPYRAFARRVLVPWSLQGVRPTGEALEVGTGSGAMATQLLSAHPDLRLVATDYDLDIFPSSTRRAAKPAERSETHRARPEGPSGSSGFSRGSQDPTEPRRADATFAPGNGGTPRSVARDYGRIGTAAMNAHCFRDVDTHCRFGRGCHTPGKGNGQNLPCAPVPVFGDNRVTASRPKFGSTLE